ncbi:ER membrane protein complex subunit 5 isoform X1 [Dromiciops gliroides]|uniref:ER membrane protein complex subunit 5 isoform X1 n=1 Tax=Dromiciops gliroides TaxID=33562 RepID=UPI001CC6A126|nr:ER membrane protein complex subunit 5 isoform X1 [Dromiciops gliroides]
MCFNCNGPLRPKWWLFGVFFLTLQKWLHLKFLFVSDFLLPALTSKLHLHQSKITVMLLANLSGTLFNMLFYWALLWQRLFALTEIYLTSATCLKNKQLKQKMTAPTDHRWQQQQQLGREEGTCNSRTEGMEHLLT